MTRRPGPNQPLPVHFVLWFGYMLQGDPATSTYGSNQPATTMLIEALPHTLSLAFLSFVVVQVIAVPVGIISATCKKTAADMTVSFFAFAGLSMPDLWPAVLLFIAFAANLRAARHGRPTAVRGLLAVAVTSEPALHRDRPGVFGDQRG